MIFGFSLIALFAAISVFYYIRAENLSRQIQIANKEANAAKKDSKAMADVMAVVAKKHQDIALTKFNKFQESKGSDEYIEILLPLFNNYATIFREAAKGKGQLHKIAKKCCEGHNKGNYKKLTNLIARQDAQVKRAWASNSVSGFISFIDAMVTVLEHRSTASVA